ncbi:MAG: hypothetical protein N838_07955 [Thiohalocapsa sp. PB-PSB1]|jgi:mRNA deadenylase 3'-5' endonuclease subunit Ccr4|nr:MAG: hypothetical protein N838_07955 [Thiohalocapsa sp. PB-PSB1]
MKDPLANPTDYRFRWAESKRDVQVMQYNILTCLIARPDPILF